MPINQRGFTVIELIVVIAVVAVIIAITVSNFGLTKSQFSLSQVAYTFAQDVSKAQNMALSGVPDASGQVDGYGVYADLTNLGNKKYVIYGDKSPGDQQYDASDYIVTTVDFSSSDPGVVLKEIDNVSGGKASVNFNELPLTTSITSLTSGQSVSFVFALSSDMTQTKTVTINTSGLVQVK